ncbi:stage II sporulation protein P [Lysinibacillus sp. BPa_S21]|uniref:stage II sporulation protein P n=1 Tax=Lysinibacillus sp. BPa_S21 TaxID=2932478 RepID=UPI002012596E|nr:stage II sporulation protein P [Lysinibacillus sp. BPa_S21]MCL1694937.1 stage II sporulation protein P [Lysinibacillus sp. BPa_S21]
MTLLKKLQWSFGLLLFFFVLPVIAGQLPFNKQASTPIKDPEDKQVVYAATNQSALEKTKEETKEEPEETKEQPEEPKEQTKDPFKVLLLFTHSQESYQPMVKAVSGKAAFYDEKTNIYNLKDTISKHFSMNGIQTDILGVDVMKELKLKGKNFADSYNFVRPYLAKRLQEQSYDLVIDFHRDSAKKAATTLTHNNESYARIAIVIGAEHKNYRWNTAYAESLSASMNEIVPKISRGVISKSGDNVDGRYNQDLTKEMILIEIGGIDNTEAELNRTIAVIGKAIAKSFITGKQE